MVIKRIAILAEGKISAPMIIISTVTTIFLDIISIVLHYAGKHGEEAIIDILVGMNFFCDNTIQDMHT